MSKTKNIKNIKNANTVSNMEFDDKIHYEKQFISHTAVLKELDERTQIVSFKKAGTVVNSIEFIFRDNKLIVSGDLDCAIFNFTMCPKWNSDWNEIEIDYFVSKCKAFEGEKYLFDKEVAIKNIKEKIIDVLCENYNKKEATKLANEIAELAASNVSLDYVLDNNKILNKKDGNDDFLKQSYVLLSEVNKSSTLEIFRNNVLHNEYYLRYKNYYEDELFELGKVVNPTFEMWLYALKLVKDQLEKNIS